MTRRIFTDEEIKSGWDDEKKKEIYVNYYNEPRYEEVEMIYDHLRKNNPMNYDIKLKFRDLFKRPTSMVVSVIFRLPDDNFHE